MRCQWVDPESGKKCKSTFAPRTLYDLSERNIFVKRGIYKAGKIHLCAAHAKVLGVFPEELEKNRRQNISLSMRGLRNHGELNPDKKSLEKRELPGGIGSGMPSVIGQGSGGGSDIPHALAKEIVEGVFGDQQFDLDEFIAEIKKDGVDVSIQPVIVDLLVLWWVSDPISRIPKDISQVAYILKISKGKLNQLLNGEEFQGKLDSMRMQRYSRVLPLLEKRMMIKALEGDSDAENWLRNVYRKIDARRTSQDITLGVDEKLLDMLEKGNINLPVEMDDKDVSAIVYREIINQ